MWVLGDTRRRGITKLAADGRVNNGGRSATAFLRGLSSAAFEAALSEVRDVRRVHPSTSSPWSRVARYAGAMLGTGVMLVIGAAILNDVESAWLVRKLLDPVSLGVGAAIALRFKVRPLALVLGGLSVATGAEFFMDVWAGRPAIRGAAPHFGLMIAGVAGVLPGSLVRRSPRGPDAQHDAVAQPVRVGGAARV